MKNATFIHPFPKMDMEKEWKRWNQFLETMNGNDSEEWITPKEVVWKKNKSTLYYYAAKDKKYETPILIVYSLVNKPFILDFAPGASCVEGLTNLGYDVYLLDWGEPGYEDRDTNLSDYVVDYLDKAVKRVLHHSNAEDITLFGYCLGGTLAAMYTAITDEPIKNLIVATIPVDFSVMAGPKKWAEGLKNGDLNISRLVDVYGNIPASFMKSMFRAVTSPVYYTPYVSLLNRAYDKKYVDKWARMNKWTSGHVAFAGAAFKQMMEDFTKDNKLIKGELNIRGKQVDLKNIKANVFAIASKRDQIVPIEQTEPFINLVSSEDKTYKVVDAGHVSLAYSKGFPEMLDEWLKTRSNELAAVN